MILHLGSDITIPTREVIAIIDLECAKKSQINEEFLKVAEEEGFVWKISNEKPKSLILSEVNKKSVIFMSPISSATLLKRSRFVEQISLDTNSE